MIEVTKVEFQLIPNQLPLLALCTVTLEGGFEFAGIRVIQTESGPRVERALGRASRRQGKYADIAHPLSTSLNHAIDAAIEEVVLRWFERFRREQ